MEIGELVIEAYGVVTPPEQTPEEKTDDDGEDE